MHQASPITASLPIDCLITEYHLRRFIPLPALHLTQKSSLSSNRAYFTIALALFTPAHKLVTPKPNPDFLPIVPTLSEACLFILSIDLLCSETRLTACRELLDHRIVSQESTEDGTHIAPIVIPLLVVRKTMGLSQMAMREQTD